MAGRRFTAAVVGTGLGWTGILLARTFLGGTVGLADNQDSRRLFCQLDLLNRHPWAAATNQYLYTTWDVHRWYGEACGADGSGEPYHTTAVYVLWLGKVLNPLLGMPGALDTRTLGVIYSVCFGALLAALVALLPGPLRFRLGLASAFGLVCADPAWADYFVSGYSEAASIMGVLALLVAVLFLWRSERAGLTGLLLVTAATAFTIFCKTQLASLLPGVAIAMLALPSRLPAGVRKLLRIGTGHPAGARARRNVLGHVLATRAPALVLLATLLAGAVFYQQSQPRRFAETNAYTAVFLQILPRSPDKEGDLRWFGLDPALAKYSGYEIDDPASAARTPMYEDFAKKVTPARVIEFYATHPTRVLPLTAEGVAGLADPAVQGLGDYPPDSGKPPGAKDMRMAVVSGPLHAYEGLAFVFPLLGLLVIGLGSMLAKTAYPQDVRKIGMLGLVVAVGACLQFWTVMFTEGTTDMQRHLAEATFMTALLPPMLVGLVLTARRHGQGAG